MSIARHHAEWQTLVDVSGPFLSMSVLERVFPQGIDDLPSELRERLRLAHEEWLDATLGRVDIALHHAWIRLVFREALGADDGDILQDSPALRIAVPEQHDTLAATFALRNPEGRSDAGQARLLVSVLAPDQDPDKALAGATWKAAPVDRMLLLLRGLQVRGGACRIGLVTNGAEWVLVHVAPNETPTYVRWQSELWFDEPLTLRAFATLLGARRLFGVPDDETLEALFARSTKDAHEVTDRLGAQVRRATEVLVRTIDRLDRDRRGKLLEGIPSVVLYQAAVTLMMRLVFVLAAEERKLLLLGTAVYDQHYAVSTLHDQLQAIADRHGEEVLERRYDAWCRLLATFRALFGGIEHVDLRLPAHGGSLFDPDRFPFLEGRRPGTSWRDAAQQATPPLAIDNRTVLHLLRAITRLEVRPGGGRTETRRLSFRALGVEQIGHVYEGLLDHTARRADDVTLSLDGKLEPEIPVGELERRKGASKEELVSWLVDETGRSQGAIEGALTYRVPKEDERRLLLVCENQAPVYERVKPWAGLLRNDTHGQPAVIPSGAVYVTEGADRRSTGTHYTPPILTEPIVKHTLDPLVYEGPAEGEPRDAWRLRSAKEILGLRVCDLAMGSGAFLVQACRYLSERLVEVWETEEKKAGTKLVLAPDGRLSTGEATEQAVPLDDDERLVLAKRYVADRCLYGVDVNPAAVEMGKLSLWLTTMQKGRPFSFVDHALRCGDSLLGVTDDKQLLHFHLDPARGKKLHDNILEVADKTKAALARAREAREKLESFATNDIHDAQTKAWLLRQAMEATDDLRLVGDLLIGAALATAKKGEKAFDDLLQNVSMPLVKLFQARKVDEREARRSELEAKAQELLNAGRGSQHAERRPFHWALEFPEVMQRGGFDAFVGNPPFMGGQKLTGQLGTDYRDLLVEHLANGRRGSADLCAYFFLRAGSLVRASGGLGLLATNTIAQGDTREVGLDALVASGFSIPRAISSRPWPGDANLEVAHIWIRRGSWAGTASLDERETPAITSQLGSPSRVSGKPFRLAANAGKAFIGSYVLGLGFTLEPEEARALTRADQKNKDVLFPYLNGQDLNSDPEQQASRWVINFRDWPLDRKSARDGYRGPVAADYPDCLQIVQKLVKPERDRTARAARRERWWQYAERAPALYAAIADMKRVLVRALTGKHNAFAFVTPKQVIDQTALVFVFDDPGSFAVLNSAPHMWWALEFGATLRLDPRYTLSDCFDTFPFPVLMGSAGAALAGVGDRCEALRSELGRKEQLGLTKLYNLLHDRDCKLASLQRLRDIHVEIDEAVKRAYGWANLPLDHGFHETKQGLRFTISGAARVEVIDRLLALNHERYTEEVKAGLHPDADGGKVAKKSAAKAKKAGAASTSGTAAKGRRKRVPEGQRSLLDEGE